MTELTAKEPGCVERARAVRDRLSAEIEGMSYAQLTEWLRSHRYADPLLQSLADRAAGGAQTERSVGGVPARP
jgi:hypothetical protein